MEEAVIHHRNPLGGLSYDEHIPSFTAQVVLVNRRRIQLIRRI